MESALPYNEDLLHWLWKNRHLRPERLQTSDGDAVRIIHPGYANSTDGPDFRNARICIGPLLWHGDVEIHWQPGDWTSHGHQKDGNYNRVILHVVYDGNATDAACRVDGTAIPTLYMRPFLPRTLQYFFEFYQRPGGLACSGNIRDVPGDVIAGQFEEAHRLYFSRKVDDLLHYYDPSLTLSAAWKAMVAVALFDGLGIRHNREPMQALALQLLESIGEYPTVDALTADALMRAGIEPEKPNPAMEWKRKGSRPPNHPASRIRQGCAMLFFIYNTSLKWWFRTAPEASFRKMVQQVRCRPGLGTHRAGIIYGTVWLPACYLLADFSGNSTLRSEIEKYWLDYRTRLPASMTAPFRQSGMPAEAYRRTLGTVHQYRHYCRPHRCEGCNIFKFIISS